MEGLLSMGSSISINLFILIGLTKVKVIFSKSFLQIVLVVSMLVKTLCEGNVST